MLNPINDRLLVAVIPPAEELPGGLVHPRADCGPWQVGKVLAVGPGRFLPGSAERAPMSVKVGDVVVTKWRLGEAVDGDYATQLIREPGVALVVERCCATCRGWRAGEPFGTCEGFEGTGEVFGKTRATHGSECIGWVLRPGLVR